MKTRLLVFGGTTEGRELLEHGLPALCCVATDYGAKLLEGLPNADVRTGRLDEPAMEDFIRREKVTHVIDATHPYALEVRANIRAACAARGAKLLRLARAKTPLFGDVTIVRTPKEAADLLDATDEKVLLTVGSKELPAFAGVHDAKKRFYPRVLPISHVIAQCEALGFDAGHIIAMQGPFTTAMNEALLDMTGATVIVTKDGGTAGGMEDKLRAAQNRHARVILIGRDDEEGSSIEEALLWARRALNLPPPPPFPMLLPIEGKAVLIIGGGHIALRRARTLSRCGARVRAVAPEFCDGWESVNAERICRRWQPEDFDGAILATACTDSRDENSRAAHEAAKRHVPISVADCAAEGTYYFPALITSENASAAVTAGGLNPSLTHRLAERMREIWPDLVASETQAIKEGHRE